MKFCCRTMKTHLSRRCDLHGDDPWACPDFALARFASGELGIPVRDGGSSAYVIKYCPWCGKKWDARRK